MSTKSKNKMLLLKANDMEYMQESKRKGYVNS